MNTKSDDTPLRAGIAGPWRSLDPGLQHTIWADIVLRNQFESLVALDPSGTPMPSLALRWTIDPDYRRFTFKLDPNRRFSDGSLLTAEDFKNSWERSLALAPRAENASILDLAYATEGSEDFKITGKLKGVVAVDDHTLVVRFAKPFRMALSYMSRSRSAVYKVTNSGIIGTGPYVIAELSDNLLRLDPNPFHPSASEIQPFTLKHGKSSELLASLRKGEIDVLPHFPGAALAEISPEDPQVQIVPGPMALNYAAKINGTEGLCLGQRENRQALQHLMFLAIEETGITLGPRDLWQWDAQVFLDGQQGRISENEAKQIVADGQSHVARLIECSNRCPIRFGAAPRFDAIRDHMISRGLKLEIIDLDKHDYFELIRQPSKWDILIGTHGFPGGDPDGIYHAYGRSGSILSSVTYREEVGQLLEEGRQLIDMNAVDLHYQKVTRTFLRELPQIHLGFMRVAGVIRRDAIDVRNNAFHRIQADLSYFRRK